MVSNSHYIRNTQDARDYLTSSGSLSTKAIVNLRRIPTGSTNTRHLETLIESFPVKFIL